MKIKMLETKKGSVDGFTVRTYGAGSEFDLPKDLAVAFLSIGAAEAIKETMVEISVVATPEGVDLMGAIVDKAMEKMGETPEKTKRKRGRKPKK